MSKFNGVFLSGESVFLAAPREEDFAPWAEWFNREEVTRFLPQGLFPSSDRTQKMWFEEAMKSGRFIAMVRCLRSDKLLGVSSLSDINFQKGTAQASFVVPEKSDHSSYPALEARALLTDHAFSRMGLRRLWSGQVFPGNRRWTEAQSVLGWTLEGFELFAWIDNRDVAHVARTSIHFDEYADLASSRGGKLWPGAERCRELLSGQRMKNYRREIDLVLANLIGLRHHSTHLG